MRSATFRFFPFRAGLSARALILALVGLGLAIGGASSQSQSANPAPEMAATGPQSTATSALDDPRVKACLLLALRNQDPALKPFTSAVEDGAYLFNFEVVHEGVAACRLALAAFPTERKVIVAEYLAAEMLSLTLFGLNAPRSEEAAFGAALLLAAGKADNGLVLRSATFFVGSAFEYGVGTKADRHEALRWYGKAADAGDAVARREQARLESSAAPAK